VQTAEGTTTTVPVSVDAMRRSTVDVGSIAGLSNAEFSTVIEADGVLGIDRTMSWDRRGYASHSETAIESPAIVWYLAEGATHSGFDVFYLIQNPDPTRTADVTIRFLLPSGAPRQATYQVPPRSRFTLWVDQVAGLTATDVSAVVRSTNGIPIIVERAMYLTSGGQVFRAGHESAGVTAPSTRWFLAEGATGAFFDEFVLIANPGTTAATVRVTYLLPSGQTYVKSYAIAPESRFNIWVDTETFDGVPGRPLDNVAVSTTVESTNGVPVIVERAMWWPGPTSASWQEAHDSPGSTQAGPRWVVADGEAGGVSAAQTFVLVANTTASATSARVTLLPESGSGTSRTFTIGPRSRFTIDAGAAFVVTGRFGVLVESIDGTPLVVERASYTDASGIHWAAGTNALASRLP
jgi:hypothetical protein